MDSERLIVALDVPTFKEAENLVDMLKPLGVTFKVGLELFFSEGPRVVEMIHSRGGKVFLDCKFHDIPNTVAGAARAASRMGVFMFNIHVSGGIEMMKAGLEAAREEALKTGTVVPKILGVTVLTSINQGILKDEIGIKENLEQKVLDWAGLARLAGLDGVIASPKEIRSIREQFGPDFLIVTPGVRPRFASSDDQKRVMTPEEAVLRGADYIVVGRPITRAEDPVKAAVEVIKEMQGGA